MVLSAHFRPTHPEKVATIHSAVRRNMEAKIGKKSPITHQHLAQKILVLPVTSTAQERTVRAPAK
jgi:hypothetical protein